jgi:hypothetical protein
MLSKMNSRNDVAAAEFDDVVQTVTLLMNEIICQRTSLLEKQLAMGQMPTGGGDNADRLWGKSTAKVAGFPLSVPLTDHVVKNSVAVARSG